MIRRAENDGDIEVCLSTQSAKLYHMGIRGRVARSTLADANERRDWRIYADFAQVLHSARMPQQLPGGIEASRLCRRDRLLALIRCQDAGNRENAWRTVLPFHGGYLSLSHATYSIRIEQAYMQWIGGYIASFV